MRKQVTGQIVAGENLGWKVRVEDDCDASGGFLLIMFDQSKPNSGFDEWFETYDDLLTGLPNLPFNVEWEQDIRSLAR